MPLQNAACAAVDRPPFTRSQASTSCHHTATTVSAAASAVNTQPRICPPLARLSTKPFTSSKASAVDRLALKTPRVEPTAGRLRSPAAWATPGASPQSTDVGASGSGRIRAGAGQGGETLQTTRQTAEKALVRGAARRSLALRVVRNRQADPSSPPPWPWPAPPSSPCPRRSRSADELVDVVAEVATLGVVPARGALDKSRVEEHVVSGVVRGAAVVDQDLEHHLTGIVEQQFAVRSVELRRAGRLNRVGGRRTAGVLGGRSSSRSPIARYRRDSRQSLRGWGPGVPASLSGLMRAERRSAGDPYHEQCHVIFRLIFRKGVKHLSQQGFTASLTALKAAA